MTIFWDAVWQKLINILEKHKPLSSRSKKKSTSRQQAQSSWCLILLLIFHPEDEGSIFPQNTGKLPMDYMALHPRKQYSSQMKHSPNKQLMDNFKQIYTVYTVWHQSQNQVHFGAARDDHFNRFYHWAMII
jgi:hypothetical protein